MANICVFCGARNGNDPAFSLAAKELGQLIATAGHTLVYGGGQVGLMGTVANAVLSNGGEAIGVIPKFLAHQEVLHPALSETVFVEDLYERKAIMLERSDVFVVLPGGLGTLDELLEVLCWRTLNRLHKPIGVLEVSDYYERLFAMLKGIADAGFVDPREISSIVRDSDCGALLKRLLAVAKNPG